MRKKYVLDSNVLIDDPNSIEILINGNENMIHIPRIVLEEIDRHKSKTPRLKPQIREIVKNLFKFSEYIKVFGYEDDGVSNPDNIIIKSIRDEAELSDCILISNDELLKFKAGKEGILTQKYESASPFKNESESDKYSGFIDPYKDEKIENCFFYEDGKMYQWQDKKSNLMNYDTSIWKLKPLTKWQNACMMLLLDNTIPLVTIHSSAGTGKTTLAVAAALHLVLQEKSYKKIIVIKPNIEIGTELGFLPGTVADKMEPYFEPIAKIIQKLHKTRPAKIFADNHTLDPEVIEMKPLNYLRGMDLEDCVVIVDEIQNITRIEARTVLSRMGKNVKCICTGDTEQIDNKFCDRNNNAMNWIIKKFKGERDYAHIVLGGSFSRGPIADMVKRKEL